MVYFDLYLPDCWKEFFCISVAVALAVTVAVAVGFIGCSATIHKLRQSEVMNFIWVDFA